jgi:hypothetical protein
VKKYEKNKKKAIGLGIGLSVLAIGMISIPITLAFFHKDTYYYETIDEFKDIMNEDVEKSGVTLSIHNEDDQYLYLDSGFLRLSDSKLNLYNPIQSYFYLSS